MTGRNTHEGEVPAGYGEQVLRPYIGIDLAAQPRSTGVAVLREVGERCVLEDVWVVCGLLAGCMDVMVESTHHRGRRDRPPPRWSCEVQP